MKKEEAMMGDVIVLGIIAIAVGAVIGSMIRNRGKNGCSGCSGGCKGCSGGGCITKKDDLTI